MKPKAKTPKKARARKAVNREAPPVKSAKATGHDDDLNKALLLIRKRPGIRPSELNRLLNREESDGLRKALIKRRLVRKEKEGSAMRYYPV